MNRAEAGLLEELARGRFIYGTQFFRPPNPPILQREEDLRNVQKLGFNLIKVFAEWNWVNYEEEYYDLEELIRIIRQSQSLGILVDINVRLENAPYWAAQKYPDSLYVDSNGKPTELQARSNTPTGGWPGLCYDHPGARHAAERFLVACAETLGGYDNVLFDCWNEPHIEPVDATGSAGLADQLFCYCEHTIGKYRQWLEDVYKTIGNLNDRWFRKYRSFEDIRPPRKLIDYVEVTEWRKFMTWSLAEQMAWRYRTLKDHLDPQKIVMSHSVSHGILNGFSLFGCDDFQLSEHLDLYGLTLYPKWANADAYDVCADIEATLAMSRGKTCINAELQGGECICNPTGLSRSKAPQRNDFRQWVFTNVALGIKGIIYWHYRAEMLGQEAPGTGINRRDGSFTYRTDEIAKLGRFLNRHASVFNAIQVPKGDVAIIINRDSLYLNFASERNEVFSTDSIRGLHRFMLKNGVKADFLIDEMLPERLAGYRIAFLPVPLVMDEKIAGLIADYVASGGTIIADCAVGSFDRFGVAQETVPAFGLDAVFGARQDDLRQFDAENREEVLTDFWPKHHTIPPGPDIVLSGKGRFAENRLRVTFFLESYLLGTATTILEHDGKPVGTVNEHGKGKAYMLGTLATQLLLFGDEDTERMIGAILCREGITLDRHDNLIVKDCRVDQGTRGALFLINPQRSAVSSSSLLPGAIVDSYFDGDSVLKMGHEQIDFTIGAEDAACIVYERGA